MASFLNKVTNSITNGASTVLGRESLAKLSNSINSTFFNTKYKEFLKPGNIVQIISRSSHMSIQICSSQNDPNRLIVLGNGQIGPEQQNSHFTVVIDPKNGHLKFQNGLNFLALDEPGGVPCILSEPTHTKPKPKPHEYIRARNEFRLHQIVGSDEWFALESVYFGGKYISITPDGSIGITKNKAEETSHFCLHVIYVHPTNVKQQPVIKQKGATHAPVPLLADSASIHSGSRASISSSASLENTRSSVVNSDESRKKQEESERYAQEQNENNQQMPSSSLQASSPADPAPPTYGNLFPTLPN